MDTALLLFLLLLNGFFAMTEMALSASRKARLQVLDFTAIPEPSSLLLAGLVAGGDGWSWR